MLGVRRPNAQTEQLFVGDVSDLPGCDVVDGVAGDDRVPEDLRDIVSNQQLLVVGRKAPCRRSPLVLFAGRIFSAGVDDGDAFVRTYQNVRIEKQ